MKTIELAVSDDQNAEIKALCEGVRADQQRALDAYRAVPEVARRVHSLSEPHVMADDEILTEATRLGLSLLTECAPNSVLALASNDIGRRYMRGDKYTSVISLPIGSRILAMKASPADGPNWAVENLTFGCMNVMNPQRHGLTPLSDLLHLTNKDLLSPFDGKQTKFDVNVAISMVCKTDGATCDGYRIFLWQMEQVCAIGTRVEEFVDVRESFHRERVKVEAMLLRGQVRFDHVLTVPSTVAQEVLADLRNFLKDGPRVNPKSSFVFLDAAAQIQRPMETRMLISAEIMARTVDEYLAAREALVIGIGKIVTQRVPHMLVGHPSGAPRPWLG